MIRPTKAGIYLCNWESNCESVWGGWYWNYMDKDGVFWRGTAMWSDPQLAMKYVGGSRLPIRKGKGVQLLEWFTTYEEAKAKRKK